MHLHARPHVGTCVSRARPFLDLLGWFSEVSRGYIFWSDSGRPVTSISFVLLCFSYVLEFYFSRILWKGASGDYQVLATSGILQSDGRSQRPHVFIAIAVSVALRSLLSHFLSWTSLSISADVDALSGSESKVLDYPLPSTTAIFGGDIFESLDPLKIHGPLGLSS